MEAKYFESVDYVTGDSFKVELWSGWNSNINQESREETVATIASLSYGREEAKDNHRLYERLKALKHESLFEFIRDNTYTKTGIEDSLRHRPDMWTYEEFYKVLCKYDEEEGDKKILEEVVTHQANIATFKIKTPIFVARQFMRHRCFSYLEMSRRYTDLEKMELEVWTPTHSTLITEEAKRLYDRLIVEGYRPEEARSVLPLGTYTYFFVQGDRECLSNFFKLRLKKDAQTQIRELAEGMYTLIERHQPYLYTVLDGM